MGPDRVTIAEARAREDAAEPFYRGGPRQPIGRPRPLAVGDPQAPLPKLLDLLERHGALGDDGRLHEDVHLVSMGDHFDWGTLADRDQAAADGLAILAWLSAHPPDQVTLVAGNHDLARVGELMGFDETTFSEAQAEADAAYRGGDVDPAAEARLLERSPALPAAETLARDLSTFRVAQRTLVASLLRARRFVFAVDAASDLLLSHAGVTVDELAALGLPAMAWAPEVASALNAALDRAVELWAGEEPLVIPGLHHPGSAASGEARGFLLHRPANRDAEPRNEALYEGPPRRRFDPRRLPCGLTQAIGHIRDHKCRQLLGPWADGVPPLDGPLRNLRVRGEHVRYARGLPERSEPAAATLLFLDGGMLHADPAAYDLFDIEARAPASRR